MTVESIFYFILAAVCSALVTLGVRALMVHANIVDHPAKSDRKIHHCPIPLGGGLALFLSMAIMMAIAYWGFGHIGSDIPPLHLLGIMAGGFILIVGGLLDDKIDIKGRYQLLIAVLAVFCILLVGIGPDVITNPFGEALSLDRSLLVDWLVLADIMVFIWLMGIMFTTKLLDGLDGLVTGVVAIGALLIFFLSMQSQWFQPEVATLSIIFAGVCAVFLVWNWHPASIFLGQGGSLFTGFILGTLAIISGGKIATTLLVLGIGVIDIIRVIMIRLREGRPVFEGDKSHLHFALIDSGLSQRQAVMLFYAIAILFGSTTLFLQVQEKIVSLVLLAVLMLLIGIFFSKKKNSD